MVGVKSLIYNEKFIINNWWRLLRTAIKFQKKLLRQFKQSTRVLIFVSKRRDDL
jgi:hypothetical protein